MFTTCQLQVIWTANMVNICSLLDHICELKRKISYNQEEWVEKHLQMKKDVSQLLIFIHLNFIRHWTHKQHHSQHMSPIKFFACLCLYQTWGAEFYGVRVAYVFFALAASVLCFSVHLGSSEWLSDSEFSEIWSSYSETSSSISPSEASVSSKINWRALSAENLLAILISHDKWPHWQSHIYSVTPHLQVW